MATSHASANHGDLEALNHKLSPSSIQKAKQNLAFLVNPNASTAPSRRGTRAFLRSFRYITIFLFWRLVRYAKYAAVGAITAAVAGTAIGSVASGAAFVLAPTGIFAGAGVGLVWGLGKFGWRMFARKIRSGESHDANPRLDEQAEHHHSEEVQPPSADPW